MRVLMLSWEYPPHVSGGLGKHVAELVPVLACQGVEVHVVTPNLHGGAAEEQIASNAYVYRVAPPEIAPDATGLVTFAQACNSALDDKGRDLQRRLGRFDLVHAHDWLVAYSAVALKYFAPLPLVVTVHATERGRGQGFLSSDESLAIHGTEWWLTYEAWRVITVSHFMAEQVNQYFDVPLDKIHVIHNGVPMPAEPRLGDAERLEFRRRFATDAQHIVYYVGRLVYEKGVHVLVDAAASILERCGDVKFIVAGTGGQLDALRHRAMEAGVYHHFFFTGFIPDRERDLLYQVADVAVFPSLYEPFGIVALEAMAQLCPVVVSATGGLVEVVKLHETGLTCHPGSPDSLAWAVVETLNNPGWARSRAENARAEVREHYSWERVAAQTVAAYRRVQAECESTAWARPKHEQVV